MVFLTTGVPQEITCQCYLNESKTILFIPFSFAAEKVCAPHAQKVSH